MTHFQLECSSTVAHLPCHPLEPLSAAEIAAAMRLLVADRKVNERVLVLTVTLCEPPKALVLAYPNGEPVPREAELVLFDSRTNATFEVVISLTEQRVRSFEQVPGVQPAISFEEVLDVEQAVKADLRFQAVMRLRGITDMSLVMVEPWPAGYYGPEDAPTRRLSRPIVFVRTTPDCNGHAHPVEGVVVLVDLATMEVLRVEDHGVVPIPAEPGRYAADQVGPLRPDLTPLEILQPEGPSFTVEGHLVRWQKWQLRLGWTPREGLVLHQVGYADQGRVRPILYRASVAEMIVPYGDPTPAHYRKHVLDEGEHGLGLLANALRLGCDCLGHIRYLDAVMSDRFGNPLVLPNAICLHEEDAGVLWKHTDWRTGHVEVRRSRRLVVSFWATVGHYDYGFFWSFFQDGTIGCEIKLTGIMNAGAVPEGVTPKYGTLVAPGVNALIHQHFFNVRLDMMVDGFSNAVYEVHTQAEPKGLANPHGNAFFAVERRLDTEQEAQQVINPFTGRSWKVVNPQVTNALGQPVGYKLVPGENILPFAHPDFPARMRAAFTTKHLWVTPYHPQERYPAGEYPNQHRGGAGLPSWTAANRSLVNTNLVLWYTLGAHHIPRPEDWPVMPVTSIGFQLKPVGFFDRNPALDVPPPLPAHGETCGCA